MYRKTIKEFDSVEKSESKDWTSVDKYLLRECVINEGATTCTDQNPSGYAISKKRSTSEFGDLEYQSMNKKLSIKSEDYKVSSEMITSENYNKTGPFMKSGSKVSPEVILLEDHDETVVKKEKIIKYPSELYSDIECNEESDDTIDVSSDSNLTSDTDSSPETEDNAEKKFLSWQDWLRREPANEYHQKCENIVPRNQEKENISDDDDSNLQSSCASDQCSEQQPQSSEIIAGHLESMSVLQRVNDQAYGVNGKKQSPVLPKVRPTEVNKLMESTGRKRFQDINRKGDNFEARKYNEKREALKTLNDKRVKRNNKPSAPLETVQREFGHENDRRITRSFFRSIENIFPGENGENDIGQIVWGNCRGWWPGIIVDAESVGLESEAGKVCVYWIGEDLISLLNTKTQVEPFSNNLDMRLIRYLKDEQTSKDRSECSFVTLKLFSKLLNIPLLKPHHEWAETHLLGKTHLNNLRCVPLPKNVQQRLDELKRQNIKLTEKRARDEAREAGLLNEPGFQNDHRRRNSPDQNIQNNDAGPQGKFPKDFVRKSTNELLSKSQEHILPLKDQKPGVIMWGKITGHTWWPAMIVHNPDCGMKEPSFACQWILWYGDYRLSQVHYLSMMEFEAGIKKMREYITQCKREQYIKAVLSACQDYCARLSYDTSNWTIDDVLAWISSSKNNSQKSPIPEPNDGRLESRYSSHMAEKLKEIKSNQEIGAERENMIENCDALNAAAAGVPNILQVLCIVCLKICKNTLEHPFFKCFVCIDCIEEFKACIFAYGEDGKCFYCTLCAGPDTVAMCSSCDCPRVYCTACLKYLLCPTEYQDVLIKDPWLCFFCDKVQSLNKDQFLKPRSDWKVRIGQLFHVNQSENSWQQAWDVKGKKRKLRVLSLFDGIGTGLIVLDKLGIAVEDYYASEIDADAEMVSTAHFGERISRLGDVRNITKDVIEAISPIDLLIGGSPCNDLSLVNPNRLGLNDPEGTGVLFYDYCRVKQLVIEANQGHHLFWLFENVASMPRQYKLAINESLQCEPNLIDAANFSPQHRPRFFWGNLPSGTNFPPPDPSQDLQSILTPRCNRYALVSKIQTVTTRGNSLKQGTFLQKPVIMNGVPDSLWITEVEEIFGFPKHYTDIKNLSATNRQKLIGQAWSVQTITALLLPLRYLFLTNNSETVSMPQCIGRRIITSLSIIIRFSSLYLTI